MWSPGRLACSPYICGTQIALTSGHVGCFLNFSFWRFRMQFRLKVTIAAAVAACAGAALAQEQTVTIGSVAPMSGPPGALWQGQRQRRQDGNRGSQQAEHQHRRQEDHLGRGCRGRCRRSQAGVRPLHRNCAMPKVNGVVGHLNSGTTIPASKIYHECGIPHGHRRCHQPRPDQAGLQGSLPHHRQRQLAGRRPGVLRR